MYSQKPQHTNQALFARVADCSRGQAQRPSTAERKENGRRIQCYNPQISTPIYICFLNIPILVESIPMLGVIYGVHTHGASCLAVGSQVQYKLLMTRL